MTNRVGSVSMQHPGADGWDRTVSWTAHGVGGVVAASLVAVAVALGGWTGAFSHAYAAASGPVESASGARPTRQQVVDAAITEIGPPARHQEVRREHRLFSAGTIVSYLPTDVAAGSGHRTEVLSAWVERSTVSFPALTDVPTFIDCAAHLGVDGGASRCTLVGLLHDQRVEFTVADATANVPCGSRPGRGGGYHVELFSGAASSRQDRPGGCDGPGTGAAPTR